MLSLGEASQSDLLRVLRLFGGCGYNYQILHCVQNDT